ncbi:hypothetical protein Bhyg_15801, partial [Pseudolycoriella hygida]
YNDVQRLKNLRISSLAIENMFSENNEIALAHAKRECRPVQISLHSKSNGLFTVDFNGIQYKKFELKPDQIDNEKIDELDVMSNTSRIQFSTNSPLLAKYKGKIYFPDTKLRFAYLYLLRHMKQKQGTAIRINDSRIKIKDEVLHVTKFEYTKKGVSVHEVPKTFENLLQKKILEISQTCPYARYMVLKYPNSRFLHRVDPLLLHSSKYDISTDICPDTDYKDIPGIISDDEGDVVD